MLGLLGSQIDSRSHSLCTVKLLLLICAMTSAVQTERETMTPGRTRGPRSFPFSREGGESWEGRIEVLEDCRDFQGPIGASAHPSTGRVCRGKKEVGRFTLPARASLIGGLLDQRRPHFPRAALLLCTLLHVLTKRTTEYLAHHTTLHHYECTWFCCHPTFSNLTPPPFLMPCLMLHHQHLVHSPPLSFQLPAPPHRPRNVQLT